MIINLRATQSESLYRQFIGRGTRIYCPHGCRGPCEHADRKSSMLVLDFLWQFKTLGPMTPANLIATSPQQAKAIQEKLNVRDSDADLMDVESEVSRDAELSLIAQFSKKKRKGEYFDAVEWAANMHVRELWDYEPEGRYASQPITESQRAQLSKAGFVPESVKGREHADKIMAVVKARREGGLASFKQVHWLNKFGVPNADTCTQEQARHHLDHFFNSGNRVQSANPHARWKKK
jgi:type I site-specific restriction endonuclease